MADRIAVFYAAVPHAPLRFVRFVRVNYKLELRDMLVDTGLDPQVPYQIHKVRLSVPPERLHFYYSFELSIVPAPTYALHMADEITAGDPEWNDNLVGVCLMPVQCPSRPLWYPELYYPLDERPFQVRNQSRYRELVNARLAHAMAKPKPLSRYNLAYIVANDPICAQHKPCMYKHDPCWVSIYTRLLQAVGKCSNTTNSPF